MGLAEEVTDDNAQLRRERVSCSIQSGYPVKRIEVVVERIDVLDVVGQQICGNDRVYPLGLDDSWRRNSRSPFGWIPFGMWTNSKPRLSWRSSSVSVAADLLIRF